MKFHRNSRNSTEKIFNHSISFGRSKIKIKHMSKNGQCISINMIDLYRKRLLLSTNVIFCWNNINKAILRTWPTLSLMLLKRKLLTQNPKCFQSYSSFALVWISRWVGALGVFSPWFSLFSHKENEASQNASLQATCVCGGSKNINTGKALKKLSWPNTTYYAEFIWDRTETTSYKGSWYSWFGLSAITVFTSAQTNHTKVEN